MTGIIEEKGQKSIIVNGVADHVHVLVGVKPSFEMDAFIRDVKNNSSKFINQRGGMSLEKPCHEIPLNPSGLT